MDIILYRGAQEIIAELEVNPDTGEIGTDYPLDVLVKRNPIGSAGFFLHTQAQAKMIEDHIDAMQKKLRALKKNGERVKQSLKEVMQLTGTSSIESPDATFKVNLYKERDKSVDVFDERQLPQDYLREIPATYAPDKKLIEKAIKDGFDVPGARIVAKDRIEIK
jgi:hypothetical protein